MMNMTINDRFDTFGGTGPGGALGSCTALA